MSCLKVRSLAKINLFLNIVGKNSNNYHLLRSYFVVLSNIYDSILIERNLKTILTCSNRFLEHNNIVLKAISTLEEYVNKPLPVKVHIEKYIPIGAGLGGGSSNAAAILKSINIIYNLGLSAKKMADLGAKVGADVPFFIFNKSALVEGVGEKVTPIKINKQLYCLLVNPKINVSTSDIFKKFNSKFSKNKDYITNKNEYVMQYLAQANNCLENTICIYYPEIKDLLFYLRTIENVEYASISGTGSTCFAIFNKQISLENAQKNLIDRYHNYWIKSQLLQL